MPDKEQCACPYEWEADVSPVKYKAYSYTGEIRIQISSTSLTPGLAKALISTNKATPHSSRYRDAVSWQKESRDCSQATQSDSQGGY